MALWRELSPANPIEGQLSALGGVAGIDGIARVGGLIGLPMDAQSNSLHAIGARNAGNGGFDGANIAAAGIITGAVD